jgi:hypothetical protein
MVHTMAWFARNGAMCCVDARHSVMLRCHVACQELDLWRLRRFARDLGAGMRAPGWCVAELSRTIPASLNITSSRAEVIAPGASLDRPVATE